MTKHYWQPEPPVCGLKMPVFLHILGLVLRLPEVCPNLHSLFSLGPLHFLRPSTNSFVGSVLDNILPSPCTQIPKVTPRPCFVATWGCIRGRREADSFPYSLRWIWLCLSSNLALAKQVSVCKQVTWSQVKMEIHLPKSWEDLHVPRPGHSAGPGTPCRVERV